MIDKKPILRELQKDVADILTNSEFYKSLALTVLTEDLLDIDYQIKNALGKQGLVVVVNTLQASYLGHDGMVGAWQIDNLEIDVVENPTVWRAWLKKHSKESGTTTDILYMTSEILGGPQSEDVPFGRFNPTSIEVGEDASLVVGKLHLKTTVRQNVTGIVDPETKVEIPFITKVELKELLDEIDYLKDLVEGFDTEEIKQNIIDLGAEDGRINGRIDALSEVYQPKGDYLSRGDLNEYAKKTQIPTEVSQLNNDSGYLTSVSFSDVKDKPDLAEKSEIPTKVSQLENDAGYITEQQSLDDYAKKEYVDSKVKAEADLRSAEIDRISGILNEKADTSAIPRELSRLENDVGFLTAVSWDEIHNVPDIVYQEQLEQELADYPKTSQVEGMIRTGIEGIETVQSSYKLISTGGMRYYTGDGEIWEYVTKETQDWTPWSWSDGNEHTDPSVSYRQSTGKYVISSGTYISTLSWETEDEAESYLSSASQLVLRSGLGNVITAIRSKATIQEWDIVDRIAPASSVPTKVSQLENDAGYISRGEALQGYATETYVDAKVDDEATLRVAEISRLETSIQGKASKSEIPTAVSQLNNDSGYLTQVSWEQITGRPGIPTKTSELENDAGFLKSVTWSEMSGKPYIPTKTSDLYNDSGFLKSVTWSDISERPDIPTKTSDLTNDSGYITGVTWTQIGDKPDIPTQQDIENLESRIDRSLDEKLDKSEYNDTDLYSISRQKKIDGDGYVYESESQPGHYTPWVWSDGNDYSDGMMIYHNDSGWYIGIDQDTYSSRKFETEAEAQNELDTSTHIDWYGSSDPTTVVLTSDREYIQAQTTWTKTDELAYKSDIEQTGISEEECRTIVEGYGYQTSDDVESAITSKGYRTEQEVDGQITAKGYQTEQQVRSIAATVLPSGYSETVLTGTMEDGTEVSFTILTKANA